MSEHHCEKCEHCGEGGELQQRAKVASNAMMSALWVGLALSIVSTIALGLSKWL